MARVKSTRTFVGTVEDKVYYILNGQPVVRSKPKKKRGPKPKSHEKVKTLNNEFAAVSSAAKLLRQALEAECAAMNNSALHSGLMKTFLAIKNEDPAEKGQRTLEGGLTTAKGIQLLKNYRFQKHRYARPSLMGAEQSGTQVTLRFSEPPQPPCSLIELQISFSKGDFRRAEHDVPELSTTSTALLTRKLRSKKGYTEMWFLKGKDFLGGVLGEV